MRTDNVYEVEDILFQNQTEQILGSKARQIGKNFYHYTRVENVLKILSGDESGNCFFHISNLLCMNDVNEATLHRENGDHIHSFCLCCSKHEKIPLWYLYSGICGKGARIGFTPGKMLQFLRSIDTVYPVVGGQPDYEKPLKIHRDFEMQCGWVYYLMDGRNRVFYRNEYYPIEVVRPETMGKCYFIKDYPWEYEREFRIVIENKTEESFLKIALPLPKELIPTLEIMFAPEHLLTEEEKTEFIKLGIKEEKLMPSGLKIHMDLLKQNKEYILNQMNEWCEEDSCESLCAYIYGKKCCKYEEDRK